MRVNLINLMFAQYHSRRAPGWHPHLCAAFLLAVASLVSPAFGEIETGKPAADGAKDAPWLAMPDEMVDALLRAARVVRRDLVVDLGAGDGRIPIAAAAKFGAQGLGIESDPEMIAASRKRAEEHGVSQRVEFRQGDPLEADLAKATVITIHLAEPNNVKLRAKLLGLKPGTRIASYRNGIPDWEPDETVTVGEHKGMLWVVPIDAAGNWRLRMAEGRGIRDFTLTITQRYQRIDGDIRGAATATEQVKLGFVRGDRVSFLLPGESGDRSFFAQVIGEVMSGTLSDGVRSVRFRADRTGR
jgi:SAM-dependent methyltransferase